MNKDEKYIQYAEVNYDDNNDQYNDNRDNKDTNDNNNDKNTASVIPFTLKLSRIKRS